MKKTLKTLLSIVIIAMLVATLFSFNVSAASVTIGGTGEFEVGKTFNVTVKFNADATLYAVEADVTYNASVLRLNSVSGADYTKGTGSVKIVDDGFSASKPSKTSSYTLNFTAIAAGSSNITASLLGSGDAVSTATATQTVNVVVPKPSSNANLSSIKLSAGSLTPAFDPDTFFYDVTVKYDVDEITITGTKADGKSTYIGGGTFALDVTEDKNGDGQYTADELNEQVLSVTAEDGSKKSYIIYIRRLTEEETLAAEDDERNSNPTLVVINGVDYTIDNELNGVEIPAGFTKTTTIRKESEITVLTDAAGKYQLCWLIDNNGQGAFYIRDEADNFTKLIYINAGGKLYIVEPLSVDGILPSDYKYSECIIDGVTVKCIAYADDKLNEFNIFNCYIDGKTSYYRLDNIEGTMQRAMDLVVALETKDVAAQPNVDDTSSAPESNKNILKNANETGKLVLILIVAVAVMLIAIAIMLIVKISSSKNDYDYDDDDQETNAQDFIFGDESENDKIPSKENAPAEQPEVAQEAAPADTVENTTQAEIFYENQQPEKTEETDI